MPFMLYSDACYGGKGMPPMPVPSICYGGIPVSVMSDSKGCYTPIGDTGMPFYGY